MIGELKPDFGHTQGLSLFLYKDKEKHFFNQIFRQCSETC